MNRVTTSLEVFRRAILALALELMLEATASPASSLKDPHRLPLVPLVPKRVTELIHIARSRRRLRSANAAAREARPLLDQLRLALSAMCPLVLLGLRRPGKRCPLQGASA